MRLSGSDGRSKVKAGIESIKDRDSTTYQSLIVSKENPIIKITGNNAWLICDNIWHGTYEGEEIYIDGLQITFLEKVNGEWKISFAGWLNKPQPEEDDAPPPLARIPIAIGMRSVPCFILRPEGFV